MKCDLMTCRTSMCYRTKIQIGKKRVNKVSPPGKTCTVAGEEPFHDGITCPDEDCGPIPFHFIAFIWYKCEFCKEMAKIILLAFHSLLGSTIHNVFSLDLCVSVVQTAHTHLKGRGQCQWLRRPLWKLVTGSFDTYFPKYLGRAFASS